MTDPQGRKWLPPSLTKRNVIQRTGHHLLTRQSSQLSSKVPLDRLVIAEMKQSLPFLYTVEIASLCKSFHQTPFDKSTVKLDAITICKHYLTMHDVSDPDWWNKPPVMTNLAKLSLLDKSKHIDRRFREREFEVPTEQLSTVLSSITASGAIRKLETFAKAQNDPVLETLVTLSKLKPIHLSMSIYNNCPQNYFERIMLHFAGLKRATLRLHRSDYYNNNPIEWNDFMQSMLHLAKLERLSLIAWQPLIRSDCLQKIVHANSHLQYLQLNSHTLRAALITENAVSTIANIRKIRLAYTDTEIAESAEAYLCGHPPSLLTKIAFSMPPTGNLKITFRGQFNHADAIRVADYLLSLGKTGTSVVTMASFLIHEPRLDDLLEDLRHYYHRMSLKWHSDYSPLKRIGYNRPIIRLILHVGSAKICFCEDLGTGNHDYDD